MREQACFTTRPTSAFRRPRRAAPTGKGSAIRFEGMALQVEAEISEDC